MGKPTLYALLTGLSLMAAAYPASARIIIDCEKPAAAKVPAPANPVDPLAVTGKTSTAACGQ
ncbi:hypothetical protein GY644_25045, partial [Escherichia coli]